MANTYGGFSLPTPNRTSQLTNDSQYTSARDYIIQQSDVEGSDSLEIADLTPGSVIYKIEINISTAFNPGVDIQGNLGVYGDGGATIIDPQWNDPNEVGNYVNSCRYTVGESGKITLRHNLGYSTAGLAVIRLFIYDLES